MIGPESFSKLYLGVSLEEIATDAELIAEAIENARIQRSEAEERIEQAVRFKKNTLGWVAFNKALEDLTRRYKEVILGFTLEAIKQTKEYDLPIFIQGITEAINNDRIAGVRGTGYQSKVIINLDDTAGTLDDYGQSVAAVRKILDVSKTPPKLASKMWKEKIFQSGREGKPVYRRIKTKGGKYKKVDVTHKFVDKYLETIKARHALFDKPAPWWSLLNYGNKNVGLPSDIGGTPYPDIPATNFKEKAEEYLTNELHEQYRKHKRWETDDHDRIIERYEQLIKRFNELIDLLVEMLEQLKSEKYRTYLKALNEKVDQFKKIKGKLADPKKVERLALELSRGVEITRRRLGGDVRIRLVRLNRQIEEELRKNDALNEIK